MAERSSIRMGSIRLASGMQGETVGLDPDMPFRILILGDFRGAGRGAARPFAERRPVALDRDNVDEVLAQCAPETIVPLGPSRDSVPLRFRELDDFDPDRLFDRLDVFSSLDALRQRLQNPSTFAAAADAIKGWVGAAAPPSTAPAPSVSVDKAIEDLLGESRSSPAAAPRRSEWDDFLHRIAGPHLVAATDPRLADFERVLDEAISAQMRAVLHHPDFQALEALWRGVAFLVRRLETDAFLSVHLLDVTKEELAADMRTENLNDSAFYQHLVTRTVGTRGGQPWALVAAHFTLGGSIADIELLANAGQVAAAAGTPLLAGADGRLVGCASLHDAPDIDDWRPDSELASAYQQLRALPQARYLGLALPRFLLRLPFGKKASRTERFEFDEMPAGSPHESYLWGNSALACAVLLGQAFSSEGWNLDPGRLGELAGLPIHVYDDDGERRAKPSGEIAFRDKALERVLESGLIAILSQPASDKIRVARLQSVASSPTPLAGRWGG